MLSIEGIFHENSVINVCCSLSMLEMRTLGPNRIENETIESFEVPSQSFSWRCHFPLKLPKQFYYDYYFECKSWNINATMDVILRGTDKFSFIFFFLLFLFIERSSRWGSSAKKVLLDILQNSQENTCARVSLLKKSIKF